MTDKELIDSIINEPQKGIDYAMREYGALVNGIVIKIIGNKNTLDRQECIANVFIKLWKYSVKFNESRGSLKSYIVTIARNEAFDQYKKIQKQKNISLEETCTQGEELDIIKNMSDKMNEQILRESINELREVDRQIFVRRYFWAQRVKTIAVELNLDEKYIENRLYKVKKRLKKNLIERGIIYE